MQPTPGIAMATAPVLSARGIKKSFQIGNRTLEVLHGIDLDLLPGERLCIMGASGAGKTTLLQILGLLDAPTEGTVWVDGVETAALASSERARLRNARLGFVFQFYHLLPELSALENVLLPAMIAHSSAAFRMRRAELRERASQMLASFGLGERMTHRPAQLSGGEQQRVAIARALFLEPRVLIADEPTGNLDRASGERVLDLLLREQERRSLALLLVTHDERLAGRCQRVVHIDDGRVQGT
jgi:lipoprotein-releasing system ATP-binding protein